MIPSYNDIIQDKKLTHTERLKDLRNLITFDALTNQRKFCGNAYLYHYQLDNLARAQFGKKPSLYLTMRDEPTKLYEETVKRARTGTLANRMFECYRVNRAPIVFFKPATAKFIYKKFGATSVLDPTAGWGGRMLGAYALGIKYTGFDTNTNLKPAYDSMITELGKTNLQMIYESSLTADFSTLDYDFVLTSPPYINLEIYEHMTPFESESKFYDEFLKPLITKCITYCKKGGWVCFNISPKMYDELIKRGFTKCTEEHDLLQQKNKGKDKQDKIYCWNVV